MKSVVQIRPATLAMARRFVEMHAESFGLESWNLGQFQGSLKQPTTRAWIAVEETKDAGFILCQVIPGEAEILTLCVNSENRRQGVGALLMRTLIDYFRKKNGGKIFLEVAANNVAARGLYEKQGFSIIGSRANYYKRGAITVDAVMYELDAMPLSAGAALQNIEAPLE